jgi:hypothetical protein
MDDGARLMMDGLRDLAAETLRMSSEVAETVPEETLGRAAELMRDTCLASRGDSVLALLVGLGMASAAATSLADAMADAQARASEAN